MVMYDVVHVVGSALRSAGGPSFDSAVKEVSDKTTLAMAEGKHTQRGRKRGVLFH